MSLYTSRSEFDIEKRVHFTNEIPPYDMFGGLNTVLQTDLWKWVLGFTDVEFGLPYEIDVERINPSDGTKYYEKSHEDGIDSGEVYYKMVNGKLVEDVQYGPAPEKNEKYHRLEEYGVLLPEFDFLLHEVYRYLGAMYPDHPDMTALLTENEFNDMVINAGAVIDYEPNVKFFDKVASSLGINSSDELIESAMLKIRNLKNEGFRKRVYGSKMGFRMLASDIFQNATVFPVATYLPIKPVNKKEYLREIGTNYMKSTLDENEIIKTSEYNEKLADLEASGASSEEIDNYRNSYLPVSPMVDVEQLKEWNESTGHSYDTSKYSDYIKQQNRVIDTYSKHYNRKFRLVDYDGSKSSYPKPKDMNNYAFGYSLPFHEYTIFESPACSDTVSMFSSFEVSNEISINDYDHNTNYIKSKNNDISLLKIVLDPTSIIGNRIRVESQIVEEIHSIDTTSKNKIVYKELCVYPPMSDKTLTQDEFDAICNIAIDTFIKEDKKPSDFEQYNFLSMYYSTFAGKGFTKDVMKGIVKKLPVIYNPLVENTLFTTPSNLVSFYPHSVGIEVYNGDNPDYKGAFYVPETPVVWDCIEKGSYLAIEDLSDLNTNTVTSTIQVTNFTKGYVDIIIDEIEAQENAQVFNVEDTQRVDDSNGIVIENENGDLIVLEGKLTVKTMVSAGRYILTSEHFDIAAIPLEKTESMMKLLYEDYPEAVRQLTATGLSDTHEWTNQDYVNAYVANGFDETIARNYYSEDDELYLQAKEFIKESDKDYPSFLEYVKKMLQYEENIAKWRKNSEYLYNKTTYTINDGDEYETEESTVQPRCKVLYILKASKSMGTNNVPETIIKEIVNEDGTVSTVEVFNESSYQNKIDYVILTNKSGYLPGEIRDISLGNLNVCSIYNVEGSIQHIPNNPEILESTIALKSPSGQMINYSYVTTSEEFTQHDYAYIIDSTNNEKEIQDYYEQAVSSMDRVIEMYTLGKKDEDSTNLIACSVSRETIQIESVIDVEHEGFENVIFFESDLAREMFKSLSVGDIVTGPSIDSDDNDVFITHIGDNEVTVNVNLQQSGTFVLNYYVKTNVTPDDITDNLLIYKERLYNNGLYSVTNPFEHGLWPSADYPRVSTAILDSLPDISFFDIHNYHNGVSSSFTRVLEDTHWDEYTILVEEKDKSKEKYLMPSDIKFNNELFLEFNLNKLLYYPTIKSKTNPILMSVEWLDYIEDSLMQSSRATDNVNVGVNVMLETDTTGYYTLLNNMDYTDPQIRLKFITLNLDGQDMWPERSFKDNDWTIPCYAQVGNGGKGRRNWFKSPDDITYPNVWGNQVYDNVKDPKTFDENSDFYNNYGELRKVSVYGQDQSDLLKRTNTLKYTSVESPLFEIPLGEYDTVTKYSHDVGLHKNLLSITQASFYSQTFTNIMKYLGEDESNIKIIGNDFTKNNVLISCGNSDDNTFIYAGVWTPTKKPYYDESGKITNMYELVYPESPLNFQYYVIEEDVNLSNIIVKTDGKVTGQTTRTFKRADILFYYKDTWYVKGFQYIGLVGDGFDYITEIDDKYNRIYVTPDSNLALSDEGTDNLKGEDGTIVKYKYTLKERLLQYYLRAANTKSPSYYATVIRNTGFDDKVFYVDSTDLSSKINLTDALEDFGNITPIHRSSILYWIYAGTFSPDETKYDPNTYWKDTRDRDWLKEPDGINYHDFFNVGDRLALINFNPAESENGTLSDASETDKSEWYIFKINLDSILGISLPISKWQYVTDAEYSVILDRADFIDDSQKCGINSLLGKINSTINLPRSYITEGSYNFNFTIDPHFVSTGYLYNSDNMTIDMNKEVKFCTTKGAVYYDTDNDAFYTFSNLLGEDGTWGTSTYKVAIKFNEQKFFKNTLRLPCVYQVKNTLVSGEQEIKQTPTLTGINGLEFPIDKLSVGDKLLEVKELDLRSLYSTSLEPIFFSNYFNVNYPVKGVTENNELYLSYIPSNPTNSTEKYNFITNVMNLIPMNTTFDETTNTYSTTPATDQTNIDFGGDYENPQLSNISITKPLLSDSYDEKDEMSFVNREFEYFKNNLVVRGKINTSNPKVIMTPNIDGSLFKNAVGKINVGDTLVGAYALGPTGNEDKFKISINVDGQVVSGASIQYAYFANGQFRAVQKDGVVYFNNDIDVASVTSDIVCKKSIIYDNIENSRYQGDVVMVGWSKDLGWYVEINLKDTTSIICSLDISETIDQNGNNKAILSQAYMSNGKHVYVDYDNGNEHTLVGHTIGEYNKDYLTPRTLTVRYNGKTEGLQIMSENTEISYDNSDNTIWTTKVYDGDNLDYTVKVTIEKAEEFIKAAITDNSSSEEIVKTFDGNFRTSETYNVEKIDKEGNIIMYLLYETSSTSKTNGSVIIPKKNANGTFDYTTYTADVYITEGVSIWKEYSYGNEEPSGEKYTYEKSDEVLTDLDENAVVKGLGKQYSYVVGGDGEDTDIMVLYRDLALSSAKLTQSSQDKNVYELDGNYISEPYFTDTTMTVNADGSKTPVASTLLSRSILKKDNSGKYTVYAKGRSLFVKSPTSLVEKTKTGNDGFSNGYSYNGFLTANSLWKHANAPIFNEKMFLTIRSTLVTDKQSVNDLVKMSMMRMLEILGHSVDLSANRNAGITVDGRAMSIDYDNALLENIRSVFKTISGYKGVYTSDSIEFDNVVTYENVVSAMDYAKSNKASVGNNWVKADGSNKVISSADGYPLLVQYSGNKWTFRCYGFRLVTETVSDGYDVIGASKQTFAELAPTASEISKYFTSFELPDDGPIVNYEHAFATFAYYYTYYLCGNAENTEIVSSSNISDIQFTDSNMLVTDTRGNINSIGLCYLHNRDDIENPEHWNASSFPQELSCYAVERNILGTSNYRVGSQIVSIPRPEVLTKQNTFKVECSYANEEIILFGGYIYSQTQVEAIYDDFFRGDKTDSEYQNWKNNRSDDEKAVLTRLLEPSKFKNHGTPVLLYSVDKGSTFSMTTLKSTSGKSLEWEQASEPATTSYVSGIVFADNEYKVFVRNLGDNENLAYYYYIEQDDDGLFDFDTTTGSKDMDDYGDISLAHEFDVDSTTGTNDYDEPSDTSTSTSQLNSIPTGYYRMMFTEGADCFYILSTKAVRFGENVIVQSKTSGSITVTTALTKEGNSEFEVLLAFNVRENINNSLEYINMERAEKYVGEMGTLRVPEVTRVDDVSTANRFYSYREILNPESLDITSETYDPYGYPAVIEDTKYSLYEYTPIYNSDTGETVNVPVTMTNSNGDTVYLCDATGKFYIFVDKVTNRRLLGTLEMRGSYAQELFQVAYKPLYATLREAESNPSIRLGDDEFRELLDLDGSVIVGMSYDNDTPYVKMSTNNSLLIKDIAEYLFSSSDSVEFLHYLSSTTDLLGTSLEDNTKTEEDAAIARISNITYDTGRVEDGVPVYEQRFILKSSYITKEKSTTTNEDGTITKETVNVEHKFWFDKVTNEYPLKKKRYLSALALVPYCFKAGITAYKNMGFDDISGSDYSLPNPITGVYLSNFGYGGSRNNTTFWENTVPWLVDPEAFTLGEYLTNSLNEPVYMVDASGKVLKSYDAEQEKLVGDSFSIGMDFLGTRKSKDLYVYSDSTNTYKKKITRLYSGAIQTFTPIKDFKLGTTPFCTNLWNFQSYKLVDIDKDINGNPNISFKYYGKTKKDTYNYVPCGGTTKLIVNGESIYDFEYDAESKMLKFIKPDVLQKSFYVSPSNDIDIQYLLVTFYINNKKYELRFGLTIDFGINESFINGVKVKELFVKGNSNNSIYFDSYTVYQKQGTYNIIKMNLSKVGENYKDYINKTSINLIISGVDEDGNPKSESVSVLDASNNSVLSSLYDSSIEGKDVEGGITFNMQSTQEEPTDTVKLYVNGAMSVRLPIFTLGDVTTICDYVVDEIENGEITKDNWVIKTYLDDICLNDLTDLYVKYNEETLEVVLFNNSVATSSTTTIHNSVTLGKYDITKPSLFDSNLNKGYYLNLRNGSVLLKDTDKVSVEIIKYDVYNELSNSVYVNGFYGKVICRKPVYNTFKNLLDAKGFVINRGNDSIIYTGSTKDTLTVGMLGDNNNIGLSELLDIPGFNDGEKHYINMRWITQSTIRTEIANCNVDSEFIEISISEKSKFTPDRVWFNPDGYPVPPVTIGNSIFNANNNEQYTGSSYKNNNGYSIYRCNEKGHLVGYTRITDSNVISSYDKNNDGLPELTEGYIKNDDGTIDSVVVEFVLDPLKNVLTDAQIPKWPIYETCQDWFKNEFYIKGKESNPYWQVLNVKSVFNKNHVWEQKMSVNEYVRSTQEMVMSKVSAEDQYVVPKRTILVSVQDDICTIKSNADPVDKKVGSISFVLDKPASKYQTESQFIKYGITAQNPFYGSSVWDGNNLSLSSYIDSTYTVCSTQNLADPKDKESEVQEVTEFGLFNKYHQLIAYATFPPIEYRTSTQHISFTAYVKQGSCVDPSNLT